ncbi:MAG: hypothetical protein ACI4IR_09205 [Eubacterium sp.]
MKKLIAIILAAVMVFALSACSSKEYTDTVVTIPVTDENGEQVTDENGNAVTEVVTEATSENEKKSTTAGGKTNTTAENGKTTTKGNSGEKTTAKKTTTTTTKPEKTTKRKIKFAVVYPYYESKNTSVKIEYKLSKDDDKKYKELVKEDITLDTADQKREYEIKDNLTGDVDIRITVEGIDLLQSKFVIKGTESETTINLYTGVERLDGGMD